MHSQPADDSELSGPSNCQLCDAPDSLDNLVQCDKCDLWFHYQCVQVDSSIEHQNWSCKTCSSQVSTADQEQAPQKCLSTSRRSNSSRASSRASSIRRQQLELQMLEEERALQQKRDQEYLRKKHQILSQTMEESSGSDSETDIDSQAQVKQWLKDGQHTKQVVGTDIQQPSHGSQIPRTANSFNQEFSQHMQTATETRFPSTNMPAVHRPPLTKNNLAARHSVSRELHIFSGNPNEWPLFISNFNRSTELCGFSDEENLVRLQKALTGNALEAVRSMLIQPECVPRVISTLKMLFGRPELTVHSLLEKIHATPPPKTEKLETIVTFAIAVQNMCATIEATGLLTYLSNPTLIQELVEKLPPSIRLNWAIHRQTLPVCTLSHFSSWLYQVAEAANCVIIPKMPSSDTRPNSRSVKERGFIYAHSEDTQAHHDDSIDDKEIGCVICSKTCSSVDKCEKFQQLSHSLKWDAVRKNNLCRKCLGQHLRYKCKTDKICGKNNCTFKHHRLLHNDQRQVDQIQERLSSASLSAQHSTMQTYPSSVKYRVVPVVLYGNNACIKAFAFLDDGSSLTLIEEGLANELNMVGTPEFLSLGWTGGMTRDEHDSRVLSLRISGTSTNAKKYHLINAHTVKSLQLPMQSLDAKKLQGQFKHLKSLPIESYTNASPRLLIGLNNWRLGLSLKYREGKANEPVANKTRLGWTVFGCFPNSVPQDRIAHSFHHTNETNPGNDLELHNLVKQFLCTDNFGVSNPQQVLLAPDDQRSLELLKKMTHRKAGRFETGLLWKFDKMHFPDSLPMAKKRLASLQRRMNRDPILADALHKKIQEYVSKGYARKLTSEELKEKRPVWYLPVFPVQNPNKPGKLRIVWDAAAQVRGVSLNSMLLKGPDQLVSLISVLFKFRERRVALCADIKEMYHQILIREEDQHFQRFLWFGQKQNAFDSYVMNVMTFGAACSPSCAQYVKNLNAQKFVSKYPKAVKSICENHYVDDLMESVDSESEAIELANQIRFIHQQGGFDIRNWMSNSPAVIKAMQAHPTEGIKFEAKDELQTEKVLGMWWCTGSDFLTFKLSAKAKNDDILFGQRRPTKREVLRILMSIFDPLGLLANFLMYVKIMLQEVWRTGIAWDEEIQDAQYEKWMNWVRFLPDINKLQIQRCYISNKAIQHPVRHLHVFVDASENGFAAVAYIRSSCGDSVECTLIGAKTRVAPLKILSIPRLELQAAVLGTRLAKSIIESHSIHFSKVMFWSDSKIVLSWLHSDHRRYRQYVAFRVTEILDRSCLSDWRWIPSELNVADEATKWTKNPNFCGDNRWFRGPEFLWLPPEAWPSSEKVDSTATEELKAQFVGAHGTPWSKLFSPERFTNWNRLLRCVVMVQRFLHNAKSKMRVMPRRSGVFTQDELKAAENILFREAQHEVYSLEISSLLTKGIVPKLSPLASFCPYIVDEGILRSSDRLSEAAVFASKRLIILPRAHPTTNLLVQRFHLRYHHQNHETVVNELRQYFIIPRLRTVLKTVRKSCQCCKNLSAEAKPPRMSQLPPARTAAFTRPFSFVGVDYFGPMYVSHLRRTEKRWVALLTCLTTRAVHLDIVYTLSTDSCILALRNFIARRGCPIEFVSDNGTNFQGAERELREAYKAIDSIKLMETFTTTNTKWTFIPPASPHMGGSWERLVRSIKNVLARIIPNRNPSDELLRGMLMEVEHIVNSRPLTYVPLSHENDEALTPNHFLLGSSSGVKPLAVFDDNPMLLRQNWMTAQQYADFFWRRWVKEYLPTITRRTKWFVPAKPIEVGDIVLICDPNSPRNCWPKGRIIKTRVSNDGQVRSASVLTSTGVYERPALKLAVLDVRDPKQVCPDEDTPGGSVNNPDNVNNPDVDVNTRARFIRKP